MLHSLLIKEWIKLRFFVGSTLVLLFFSICYFWKNLAFQFGTIEPENMMWYRFTFLGYKPYDYFQWLLYIFAISLALVQFLPERNKNRLRLIVHLPLNLLSAFSLHITVGLVLLLIIFSLLISLLFDILSIYYPAPITTLFFQDTCGYLLGSIILFLGTSSAILERIPRLATLKISVTLITICAYTSLSISPHFFIWLLVPSLLFILGYDSLLSIKEQGLKKTIAISLYLLLVIFSLPAIGHFLLSTFHYHIDKYYLFYSSNKKEFVYQKNFGDHQFEYGFVNGETFDRKRYESYLPFIYWADLDIQKKLPIKIGNQIFDKKKIKQSRLSLSYKKDFLQKQDKVLYPLINSLKDQGVITFPDDMLYLGKNQFTVYHHDTLINQKLTEEVNKAAEKANITFPIQNIWGKFTNMKTYDLGYFIKDKKGEIFNFRRADNITKIRKLENVPKDIIYMSINENKQRKIAGFAIDNDSQLYVIRWHNLKFIPIKLSKFNYKKMNLQILSNPKYYHFRYNNGSDYYLSVFDKNFNFVAKTETY